MSELTKRPPTCLGVALVITLGCSGQRQASTEPPAPVDAGPEQDGDSSAPPCGPVAGDTCSAALCCPPLRGRRADFDAGCLAGSTVLLACYAKPGGPSSGCVTDDGYACWTREGDGGVETYFTPVTVSDEQAPGLKRCTQERSERVFALESTTCP